MNPCRHFLVRRPKPGYGFCWGRKPLGEPVPDAIVWRLFRRDHTRRLYQDVVRFPASTPRSMIATGVCHARRALRERVDAVDLAALMAADP